MLRNLFRVPKLLIYEARISTLSFFNTMRVCANFPKQVGFIVWGEGGHWNAQYEVMFSPHTGFLYPYFGANNLKISTRMSCTISNIASVNFQHGVLA